LEDVIDEDSQLLLDILDSDSWLWDEVLVLRAIEVEWLIVPSNDICLHGICITGLGDDGNVPLFLDIWIVHFYIGPHVKLNGKSVHDTSIPKSRS
jgi:hypothetical protein